MVQSTFYLILFDFVEDLIHMKPDIHPNYESINVICLGCKHEFTTKSALGRPELKIDVCSHCHPFFTGQHKIVDTAGKVERFFSRYGRYQSTTPDPQPNSE